MKAGRRRRFTEKGFSRNLRFMILKNAQKRLWDSQTCLRFFGSRGQFHMKTHRIMSRKHFKGSIKLECVDYERFNDFLIARFSPQSCYNVTNRRSLFLIIIQPFLFLAMTI